MMIIARVSRVCKTVYEHMDQLKKSGEENDDHKRSGIMCVVKGKSRP